MSEPEDSAPSTMPPHSNLSPAKGKRGSRKPPRWTITFLRALERTGEAEASARDAGIDKTTAYARRRAHADFALAWAAAVERHRAEKKRAEEEEIAALRNAPSPGLPKASPPSPARGEGLVVSNGQVKRVSSERWGKRKEAIFFDELAATNNIHRSAAAAGVSYNAVLARRRKHPLFAAKWEAVERHARTTIGMHLLEETQKSFDPAAMNLPESAPRVTIDQAIRISQIGAARDKVERDPFAEQVEEMNADDMAEVRARLLRKLKKARQRMMPEKLAQGWSYDEAHEMLVPPGWVRAAG